MRISDWSSDVCSSDLELAIRRGRAGKLKSWAICSLGVALLLLLLFRLMGLLDFGLALVTLYALGTIGLMLLRRPEVRSRSAPRSEERRVVKECFSTCRSRGSPYH